MSNKQTKNQHHIPKMILKRFPRNKVEGGIYFYDSLKSPKIQPRNIESVAKEVHLYSVIHNGNIDLSLERYFGTLEGHANNILDDIALDGIDRLDEEKISFLIRFVVSLIYRSKWAVSSAATFSRTDEIKKILLNSAQEKNFPKETAENYFQDIINIKGFAYQQTFQHILQDRHEKFIEYFDVVFLTCYNNYPKFILQDNYATFVRIGDFSKCSSEKNLWEYPVEILCPLSTNTCLLFSPKQKNKGSRKFTFSEITIDAERVMDINRLAFGQKNRYIYGACSFELMRLVNLYS